MCHLCGIRSQNRESRVDWEVANVKREQARNTVRFHCRQQMSVMHSLALQIVAYDEVEPEVNHFRWLSEHGKPTTEPVDGSARLWRGPTQPIGGHRPRCELQNSKRTWAAIASRSPAASIPVTAPFAA